MNRNSHSENPADWIPPKGLEVDRPVESDQSLVMAVREIEAYRNIYGNEDGLSIFSNDIKQHDWASLVEHNQQYGLNDLRLVPQISAELSQVELTDLVELVQQLIISGAKVVPNSDHYAGYQSWAQQRMREKYEALDTLIQAISQGESTQTNYLQKLAPDEAAKLHRQIVARVPEALGAEYSDRMVEVAESADRASNVLRQSGYLLGEASTPEIKQQLAQSLTRKLEIATEAMPVLDALAQLDGQYIAGYLRTKEDFNGVDRSNLVDLLARHDPEQLLHLAADKVVDAAEIKRALPLIAVTSPAMAAEATLQLPDLADTKLLSQLGTHISPARLYHLSNRSTLWREVIEGDAGIRAVVREQVDAQLIEAEEDKLAKIGILKRYANYPGMQTEIAEQRHNLLAQIVDEHKSIILEHPDNWTTLDQGLKALKVQEINYLLCLADLVQPQNTEDLLDNFSDHSYRVRSTGNAAERTKLATTILEWHSAQGDISPQDPTNTLIMLDIVVTTLPSDIPLELKVLLGREAEALLKEVDGQALGDIELNYDNILAALVGYSGDKVLATQLSARLNGDQLAELFENAYWNNLQSIEWMQLLEPAQRAELLSRSAMPTVAALIRGKLLPDKTMQAHVLTMLNQAHPEYGHQLKPAFLENWQRLVKPDIFNSIPGATTNIQPLLQLERALEPKMMALVRAKVRLDELTQDKAETVCSILRQSLSTGDPLLVALTFENLSFFTDPANPKAWALAQKFASSYNQQNRNLPNQYSLDFVSYRRGDQNKPKHFENFNTEYGTFEHYVLSHIQSQQTGMTQTQIDQFLSELPSSKYSEAHTLKRLAARGLSGPKLFLAYQHRQDLISILRDDAIVGESLGLEDLLESDDMIATIGILKRNAAELGSSDPDWQRYAHISANMIMKSSLGNEAYAELKLPLSGGAIPLSEVDPVVYEHEAARRLRAVLEIPLAERQAATERNMALAKQIEIDGGDFALPRHALVHETGSAAKIIASANLAGECMGIINLRTDSYPGFVDFLELDEHWGNLSVGSYSQHQRRYNVGSALVYFPSSDIGPLQPALSVLQGHKLVFAGVANSHLSLIIESDENAETRAATIAAQVETGLYVPIVSSTGELLFKPEDFAELYLQLKRFDSLDTLVNNTAIYADDLRAAPDPGGVGSIAEHMERSVERAKDLLPKAQLEPSTELVVLAAMKLHDVGKLREGRQEVTNVTAAREILTQVEDLTSEMRRQVLLLIRHDELLGEILQTLDLNAESLQVTGTLPRYTRTKLDQFNQVFSDPELRQAALVVYQADVASKRPEAWSEWQVSEKLEALQLPNFFK